MRLPGRLKATTLGDLLGSLHRARTNGTLEVVEDSGRSHRVFLQAGLVVAVEIDGGTQVLGEMLRRERAIDDDVLRRSVLRSISSERLLGEVLVTDFRVAPSVVGSALRRQIVARLRQLEQLPDARIQFRVAVRTPRSALTNEPLGADEFLRGRRRARDTSSDVPPSGYYRTGGADRQPIDAERLDALRLLDLDASADEEAIRRAYRRMARASHPDLHPAATDAERRALEERFIAVTRAYRALVA